jgi:putative FmdB family regulatory protein
MPTYEYQCEECGASVEAFQKMSDDPLEVCETCGGHLRKVMHPVAIHFKGSGFYTTDYGKSSGRRTGARETGGESAPSGAGGEPAASGAGGGDGDSSAAAAKGSDAKPGAGGARPKEKQKAT